jgi:hypothetical protein
VRRIFYSLDGFIYYWGCYSREDIAQMKAQGWYVMLDNWWNRQKLVNRSASTEIKYVRSTGNVVNGRSQE